MRPLRRTLRTSFKCSLHATRETERFADYRFAATVDSRPIGPTCTQRSTIYKQRSKYSSQYMSRHTPVPARCPDQNRDGQHKHGWKVPSSHTVEAETTAVRTESNSQHNRMTMTSVVTSKIGTVSVICIQDRYTYTVVGVCTIRKRDP